MTQDDKDFQDFLIDHYRTMDRMRADIRARFEALEGHEPTPEQLRDLCWNIWHLTTFHIWTWNAVHGTEDTQHAPYIPPEVFGARADRLAAMDERLRDVLGDAVDSEDDEHDDDEDDEDDDEFEPDAAEQLLMVEYGTIIVEYRDFVGKFNPLQLWAGDEGYVMNIIQLRVDGFEFVMQLLWNELQQRLRVA